MISSHMTIKFLSTALLTALLAGTLVSAYADPVDQAPAPKTGAQSDVSPEPSAPAVSSFPKGTRTIPHMPKPYLDSETARTIWSMRSSNTKGWSRSKEASDSSINFIITGLKSLLLPRVTIARLFCYRLRARNSRRKLRSGSRH